MDAAAGGGLFCVQDAIDQGWLREPRWSFEHHQAAGHSIRDCIGHECAA